MTMMVCMTLMCNIADTEKSGEFADGVVGLEDIIPGYGGCGCG